jgi:CubicO group peptidase (beta-lactamase class C family)
VGEAAAGVLVRDDGGGSTVSVAGSRGPRDRAMPWASVTKLTTALAVQVAVEEGTIDLDQPAGPPGSTVAHLLAHASGLDPEGTAVLAAPGRRRIYSNGGFRILGDLLAERSGLAFGVYLKEAVLEPLRMVGAQLAPGASPAAGLNGSLDDLLALGRELLAPTVVAPATLARATAVAFPGLAGVLPGFGRQDPCDWGLGFEIRGDKQPHWTGKLCSPRTFGHFGQSGCFLWVDPAAGVACAVLTDTAFGDWSVTDWPLLSDAVLAELGHDT